MSGTDSNLPQKAISISVKLTHHIFHCPVLLVAVLFVQEAQGPLMA
jgi:hypothetical protein